MSSIRVLRIERDGPILVVAPLTNITSLIEPNVQLELQQMLAQVAEPGVRHLVIDFSSIEYFGSSLLHALNMAWKKIRAKDGRMALCCLSPLGQEIIHSTRFDTLWHVHPDRPSALSSLRAG